MVDIPIEFKSPEIAQEFHSEALVDGRIRHQILHTSQQSMTICGKPLFITDVLRVDKFSAHHADTIAKILCTATDARAKDDYYSEMQLAMLKRFYITNYPRKDLLYHVEKKRLVLLAGFHTHGKGNNFHIHFSTDINADEPTLIVKHKSHLEFHRIGRYLFGRR